MSCSAASANPDPALDALLAESCALGAEFGPERLPHRRLEQEWLRHGGTTGRSRLLAGSMLGRKLDALGASRLDLYAFTHAVMYASDLGGRPVVLPRPRADIAADAVVALAHSLDTGDCDLAAEVVATWPMLGLPWSPAAALGFATLTGIEDCLGFLPGGAFRAADHRHLTGEERMRHAIMTSYHAVYVMAFLCVAALRPGRAPPETVPSARGLVRCRGAGAAMLGLLDTEAPPACWRDRVAALAPRQQDAVAPLLLAILLRRARARGDLGLLREALQAALRHDLAAAPAPLQAAALLRRCRWLDISGPDAPESPGESPGPGIVADLAAADILPGRHLR